MTDRISAAMTALKTGQPFEEEIDSSADVEVSPEEDTQDMSLGAANEPAEAETEESSESSAAATTPEDIEEIILTDDSGKKKLKVDWNDRDKLRGYIKMAAGMRKFQAERDQAKTELQSMKPQFEELQGVYDTLNSAWSKQGVEGVVNLLGGENAYKQLEESIVSRYKFLEKASPEQKKSFELEQELLKERTERERFQRQIEEGLSQTKAAREAAQAKEAEAMVYPAFEKYRFTGKLGDPDTEHRLDQAIWAQTLAVLESLPEGAVNQTVIDREFRLAASAFSKAIGKQAGAQAKKVVESKKQDAQASLSKAAAKGMKNATADATWRDTLGKGDVRSAIHQFFGAPK